MKAKALTLLAGVGLLAGTASADFVGTVWEEVDNGGVADATYDIYAQFDFAGDFMIGVVGSAAQAVDWQVNGGTFYQHPGGGFTSPTDFILGIAPSCAYDTFVTIGRLRHDPATDPDNILVAPPDLSFGASSLYITNGSWLIPPTIGDPPVPTPEGIPVEWAPGDYRVIIARLSINWDDGAGTVEGIGEYLYLEDGVNGQSVSSFFIPAPGVLALLGLAGLAGTRRRR
jgi:uncharacterized protein (TIGR03382 family)